MLRIPLFAVLLGTAACGTTFGTQAPDTTTDTASSEGIVARDILSGTGLDAVSNMAYCKRYPARC